MIVLILNCAVLLVNCLVLYRIHQSEKRLIECQRLIDSMIRRLEANT